MATSAGAFGGETGNDTIVTGWSRSPAADVHRTHPGDAMRAVSLRPPTLRQRQVYDLVVAGIVAGCPPTLRELAERLGIRSTNGVHDHLAALVRKGWLEHRPGERSRLAYWPTTMGPGLARDLPRVSEAWLYHHAERLADAVGAKLHGRATLVSDDEPRSWWRLVVTTEGWSATEDAVAGVDPTWHATTHQATVRGGLYVWAWGMVPDEHGGPLGPVLVIATLPRVGR